jgi:hypothetical protein
LAVLRLVVLFPSSVLKVLVPTAQSTPVSASRILLRAMLFGELLWRAPKYQILYLALGIEAVLCGLGMEGAIQGLSE